MNDVLNPAQKTIVLLETMAGKGTEVGRSFEEIAAIIERVDCKERLGVCLDTCHVWDAGYDIANDLDGVLEEFDRAIGLSRLHAVHLNDSLNVRAARKDRHARIGEGEIGLEALTRVIRHRSFAICPSYWKHRTTMQDMQGRLPCSGSALNKRPLHKFR